MRKARLDLSLEVVCGLEQFGERRRGASQKTGGERNRSGCAPNIETLVCSLDLIWPENAGIR